MLGITIHINDEELIKVSCVNQGVVNVNGETKYITSEGDVVYHDRDDGALELARKVLAVTEEPP